MGADKAELEGRHNVLRWGLLPWGLGPDLGFSFSVGLPPQPGPSLCLA